MNFPSVFVELVWETVDRLAWIYNYNSAEHSE